MALFILSVTLFAFAVLAAVAVYDAFTDPAATLTGGGGVAARMARSAFFAMPVLPLLLLAGGIACFVFGVRRWWSDAPTYGEYL